MLLTGSPRSSAIPARKNAAAMEMSPQVRWPMIFFIRRIVSGRRECDAEPGRKGLSDAAGGGSSDRVFRGDFVPSRRRNHQRKNQRNGHHTGDQIKRLIVAAGGLTQIGEKQRSEGGG